MAIRKDTDSIREDLNEILTNLESPGTFSVFDSLTEAPPPNPGLYLNTTGQIGHPLNDHDANAIVAISRQAPFGKGEETIVDTSIRKTWEVSPQDFELRNPRWSSFLPK